MALMPAVSEAAADWDLEESLELGALLEVRC